MSIYEPQLFDFALHKQMAVVYFTEVSFDDGLVTINADCVCPVDQTDHETTRARITQEMSVIESPVVKLTEDEMAKPRKVAKMISEYPEDP